MTEYVDGKKYRVTRDYGVMTYRGDYFLQGAEAIPSHLTGVTGELIPDPLPTTPGSVIRFRSGDTMLLGEKGRWIDTDGDDYPAESMNLVSGNWTLIYDAGAES